MDEQIFAVVILFLLQSPGMRPVLVKANGRAITPLPMTDLTELMSAPRREEEGASSCTHTTLGFSKSVICLL